MKISATEGEMAKQVWELASELQEIARYFRSGVIVRVDQLVVDAGGRMLFSLHSGDESMELASNCSLEEAVADSLSYLRNG